VINFPDDRNRDGRQNIGLLAVHHVMQLPAQESFIEVSCDYMHKLTVYSMARKLGILFLYHVGHMFNVTGVNNFLVQL